MPEPLKFFSAIRKAEYLKDPVGKTSGDECELLVAPFLERFLHYHKPFTCITVCKQGRSVIADAYGFQFELVPGIAKDVRIVCAGDFQTVIFNAYRTLLAGGKIEEYQQHFFVVPTKASEEQRRSIFENALALANTREAGEDGFPKNRALYVEARIYRAHEAEDFVDLAAGLEEYLATQILEQEETDDHASVDPELDSMSDDDFFK